MDLIILFFLIREIGKIAAQKGLKPITWKIYLVIGWLFSEIIGLVFGIMIFGMDNLVSVALVGITFGITCYFIMKTQLNKLPDQSFDDDINNIGHS